MDEELQRYRSDQAHAYLERIREMGDDCAGLQQEADDARARAEGISGIDYSAIRVRSTQEVDRIGRAIAAVWDSIGRYTTALAEYTEERMRASRCMDEMDDQTEARVLRLRYLCGWKWERICTETDYSWDGMMTLRRRALLDFYEVMPASERDPRHSAI